MTLVAVPFMPCQNLLWTIGSRNFGEERTQIALSLTATIDPLTLGSGYIGSKLI